MSTELTAVQHRRFGLYELMLEVNEIGAGALHAVLAESQAIMQYGRSEDLWLR